MSRKLILENSLCGSLKRNKHATIFTAILNVGGWRFDHLFKIIALGPCRFITFGAISSAQFRAFDGQMTVPAAHPIFGRGQQHEILVSACGCVHIDDRIGAQSRRSLANTAVAIPISCTATPVKSATVI